MATLTKLRHKNYMSINYTCAKFKRSSTIRTEFTAYLKFKNLIFWYILKLIYVICPLTWEIHIYEPILTKPSLVKCYMLAYSL